MLRHRGREWGCAREIARVEQVRSALPANLLQKTPHNCWNLAKIVAL